VQDVRQDLVPNYQLMIKLGIADTYAGLIIPAFFSAFGTLSPAPVHVGHCLVVG